MGARTGVLAALLVLTSTLPAHAEVNSSAARSPFPEDGPPPEGYGKDHQFSIGLSVGYALPFGSTFDDKGVGYGAFHLQMSGAVPIQASIGYTAARRFFLSAYGAIAPGVVSREPLSTCPETYKGSCSGFGARFGAEVRVRILPDGRVDPWVGVGLGYEWLKISGSGAYEYQGTTYFVASVGASFRLPRRVHIGPFVSFSVGQFDRISLPPGFADPPTALHEWLTIGVETRYDL